MIRKSGNRFLRSAGPKKSRPREAAGRLVSDIFLLLSEVKVDAGAQQPEAVSVRNSGDGGEGRVRKIDIEIFDLGGPLRGEADFGADTGGPARRGMGFRQTEGLAAQFTKCQTSGAVEQHVAQRIT